MSQTTHDLNTINSEEPDIDQEEGTGTLSLNQLCRLRIHTCGQVITTTHLNQHRTERHREHSSLSMDQGHYSPCIWRWQRKKTRE